MSQSIRAYIEQKAVIHLIGIGGVSMCALAELLLSYGVPVTGSDRTESAATRKLQALGARICYEHDAKNVHGAALVVRTAAVHDDNPEVVYARAHAIPVLERAEAWGALMREYRQALCVAGTHGKTTSTSMLTMMTMEAGLDPTVMVGSHLPAIGGTLRIGANECFVAESCEYCNSFLQFAPTVAIVLNIEPDHLDFFSGIDQIVDSFRKFCALVPEHGLVVLNHDDAQAMRCAEGLHRAVCTFGLTSEADVYPVDIEQKDGCYAFGVMRNGDFYAHITLQVPGQHNLYNALACCAAAAHLGISGTHAARGLNAFTGSSRRFERVGTMPCGATVVDDYAHHPTEIRATLTAARAMGYGRILCAFQPHTYTRTKALFSDFVGALSLCDRTILAPIYAAREQNTVGISSHDLAQAIAGAIALDSFDDIAAYLKQEARADDLVLTMGAGNINQLAPMLLAP